MSAAAVARHGSWRPQRLTAGALALMGNTGLSSVLGLAFWVMATRLYSPAALGQDTGLIAAVMLLSSLSELSLGQGIPRLLPQVVRGRRLAVLGAYLATGGVAVLLASAFVVVAPTVSSGFGFLGSDHFLQVVLVGSVVLWNVFALQDAVLAAVRKAILVPLENGVFGAVKIALLVPLAAFSMAHGVLGAWLIAMAAIVPAVNWLIFRHLLKAPREPAARARHLPLADRGRIGRYLAGDYAASVLSQGSTTLLPVLVLAFLGREASAYFYVAFTVAGTVNALALALGTSLVVEGSHDEMALQALARQTLLRYTTLLLPGILVLIVAAPLLLHPFGQAYVDHGTWPLRLLLAGCVPQTLVTVCLGIERVRGRAARVLRMQVIAFAAVLAGLAAFMTTGGLTGVGMAWAVGWGVAGLTAVPALGRLRGNGAPAVRGHA